MKILAVCQYYYPEPFRFSDICEELAALGHQVTVITGVPNYPMGTLYEGYSHRKRRDEVINGVRIHRCFTIPRRQGQIFRLLNYYSFALSSSLYCAFLREEYDVVLVNQLSPVMMANAGIVYKKRNGKRLALYCLDIWPESLIAGGIKRGSLVYRIFHRISRRIYAQADDIMVASQSFSQYFKDEFAISDVKYLPQYAETVFTPETCKKTPNKWVDLMFAGNIGAAQSVDTIIAAARLTADIKELHWHIVGDGSEYERLLRCSPGLRNVTFHGRVPLSAMPRYYAMADAMLVTLKKDDMLSATLPGKVQTYMAAGKPMIGAIDGEARKLIDQSGCGLCCPAEDAEGLAECARRFMEEDRDRFSENSLAWYDQHFDRKAFLNKLCDILACREPEGTEDENDVPYE